MQQNAKWTQDEDDRLVAAVKKHGTQWGLVGKEINHSRSQNAIIKRWHGHLRRNISNEFMSKLPQPDKTEEVFKSKSEKKLKVSEEEENEDMKDENEERIYREKQNTETIKKISEEEFTYKHNWTEEDDNKLKNIIVHDGLLLWEKISNILNVSVQEILARWIKIVCPKLKNNVKIGGALKWSVNEDYILYAADRGKIEHLDLMFFLPYRTVYSIEARWRRICKNSEIVDHATILNIRNNVRREALKKIALKRCYQKRDYMTKIYEKEKELHERIRLEQERYDLMRRQEKVRKNDRN